jgi:hypothetical protein
VLVLGRMVPVRMVLVLVRMVLVRMVRVLEHMVRELARTMPRMGTWLERTKHRVLRQHT